MLFLDTIQKLNIHQPDKLPFEYQTSLVFGFQLYFFLLNMLQLVIRPKVTNETEF